MRGLDDLVRQGKVLYVGISIPIIGARKLSQLQDNLASFAFELSASQLKTLDESSRIELGFPHDFYPKEMVRSLVYGGLRDQILA